VAESSKVLVSLDTALLRRLDRLARSRGISRSALIADLAERELAREVGPGADPRVHAAFRRLDELLADTPPEDSTAVIRAMRDSR
jgi:DNA-binding phage protein